MKREKVLSLALNVLFSAYLFIDMIDYISNRAPENYPSIFTHGSYESHSITYLKWVMCLLGLSSLYLNKINKKTSFFLLWSISAWILLTYFLKGWFVHIILDNVLLSFFILEISALVALALCLFSLREKYEISIINMSLITLFATVVFYLLILPMPDLMVS